MNPNNPTPVLPVAPTPPPAQVPIDPKNGHSLNYLLPISTLVLGLTLGYLLFNFLPKTPKSITPTNKNDSSPEIVLPVDAVRIQVCANRKGSLYVKPQDIPTGPIYMVYQNKVIGIEFMLGKDEFLNGKSYQNLAGVGAKIDHVNIGILSTGHEGYTQSHYHVDLYTVKKEVAEGIKCPGSINPSPTATTSATATPSSTIKP